MAPGANKRRHRPSRRRQGALALALMATAATPWAAAPVNQSFRVTVTLKSAQEDLPVATCSNVLDPATDKVVVICLGGQTGSTPTPQASLPRYLLHIYRPGEWLVDDQIGTGTLTSWRIVHVANREYLEMMVGW